LLWIGTAVYADNGKISVSLFNGSEKVTIEKAILYLGQKSNGRQFTYLPYRTLRNIKKNHCQFTALPKGKYRLEIYPDNHLPLVKKNIRVGYLPILDHLTLAVSHSADNSSYRKIDIEPRMFKKWKEVAGALRSGAIDAGFLLSNYAMHEFNTGSPIKAVLVGHRNGSGITVEQDSQINSPADLKGKNIAIPASVSTHTALLDKYLNEAGLSLRDVTTRVINPSHMVVAMQTGAIDAYIVAWSDSYPARFALFGKAY